MEGNNAILGTLPAVQENYKIFNSMEGEMDDFVAMKFSWCLIHVISIDNDGNNEGRILSCFKRNETGCYYLIESTAQNILMFRFCNLTLYAKTLFTKEGRLNLVNELSKNGPFEYIG